MQIQNLGWENVFLLKLTDMFTKDEITTIINKPKFFIPATICNDQDEEIIDTNYRFHHKSTQIDRPLAELFYSKLVDTLPKIQQDEQGGYWELDSVNPMMRYLRYEPNQFFKCHEDEPTFLKDSDNLMKRSFITFQLYLSDNQEGATNFYKTFPIFPDDDKISKVSILPKKGDLVLFEHEIYHEGSILVTENKYCLRTDILYKKIQ